MADKDATCETIRAIYEQRARTYDVGQSISEVLLMRRLRRRLLSRARGRVLEIGIGTGVNLPYYGPRSPVTGVDLSRAMLERALARAYRLRRHVLLETMDAESLTFPDRSFDTVVSTLTLCTVPDPLRALGEMARVCRPDGRVLLLEHGIGTSGAVNRVLAWLAPGHLRRWACHLTRDIASLPERAGLRLIDCERYVFGVLVLMEARPAGR
jgi:ubiquinone/menaquinone biosynthesis C-methylase UbiE